MKNLQQQYTISGLKLLNVGANAKTVKGDKKGVYRTGILYLAPAMSSGIELCPGRSPGCTKGCLFYSGNAQRFKRIPASRIARSKLFYESPEEFFDLLNADINTIKRKIKRDAPNTKIAIRLNGTSDIAWERFKYVYDGKIYNNIMEQYPDIFFYDYTKRLDRNWYIPNYHLTFSRSEVNDSASMQMLREGRNVAIVFNEVPKRFRGFEVIDGDEDDIRFLDKPGTIVGLKAKGPARKDRSGFVVTQEQIARETLEYLEAV